VIPGDPNVQSVERIAAALGELRDELVLVGGCAASLPIDAPTASPSRGTYVVDPIAVVAALGDYYKLETRFSQLGFTRELSADAPICRWRLGDIAVDLMPTDEAVLGFSNRWYAEAAATAMRADLPSGTRINLISAPAFLATKLEAFHTRGNSDLLSSHDFEDIVNVVEGRQSIVEEVGASGAALREYLAEQFAVIVAGPDFMNALPGLVAYDELHGRRVLAVAKRLSAMAGVY
jgi:hypothetical protein